MNKAQVNHVIEQLDSLAQRFDLERRGGTAALLKSASRVITELTTPIKADELQPWMRDDPDAQQRIVNDMRQTKQQSLSLTERYREKAQQVITLENENKELRRRITLFEQRNFKTCDVLDTALGLLREDRDDY